MGIGCYEKQVVFTGQSIMGEAAYSDLLDSFGYLYKDKTPPSRNTSFLVKTNIGACERRIRYATKSDVPVFAERECRHFVLLGKEMKA
jgi:hypothetical protein